jgi:hypothetical protein
MNLFAFLYRIKLYWLVLALHRFLVNNSGTSKGAEGPCFQIGYGFRQNTAYIDEERNWTHLCSECQIVNDEYWSDMWSDYYSSRI